MNTTVSNTTRPPISESEVPKEAASISGAGLRGGSGTLNFGLLAHQSRSVQKQWADSPFKGRVRLIRKLRRLLIDDIDPLAEAVADHRNCPPAEAMTSELMPFADALKGLESFLPSVLKTRKLGVRGRPAWLAGVRSEVQRRPFGIVLVIAPGNYPLFLAGVQAVQALAAGNAVWIKPAPGCGSLMQSLRGLCLRAGFAPELIQVLPESTESASAAIQCGVDKVVFTGSVRTGRNILSQLAETVTPAVMELSGNDAVFVRADADPNLVVDALAFGIALNRGRTCIAPRRVFVHRSRLDDLSHRLKSQFQQRPGIELPAAECKGWLPWVQEALAGGAFLVNGSVGSETVLGPLILSGVEPDMRLFREDAFAPVMSLIPVESDEEALLLNDACPYALSASVFGRNQHGARQLAGRIRAGSVIVNDLIAPTADPRLPFGGLGESGFGVTRGPEGLLEMTVPKVISMNRSRQRFHYFGAERFGAPFFKELMRLSHAAGLRQRVGAMLRVISIFRKQNKPQSKNHL